MDNYDNIELRSERVRNIIGQIPPIMVRIGSCIVFFIVFLLFLFAAFIPYPENVKCKIELENTNNDTIMLAKGILPYSLIDQIIVSSEVRIELEGFNSRTYGYQAGVIASTCRTIISIDGKNYFTASFNIRKDNRMQHRMSGFAYILLSNKTILERIFE